MPAGMTTSRAKTVIVAPPGLRVVERELELVLGEDEVRRAVRGDSHPAILYVAAA